MLLEQRREIGGDRWPFEADGIIGVLRKVPAANPVITLVLLAFAKSAHGTRYQPVPLLQPLFRLNGNLHPHSCTTCLGHVRAQIDREQRAVSPQSSSHRDLWNRATRDPT